jgi:ADP-heptose:LPS heptosyltransferase
VKALAVRLSSIGDVVHALPALAALRRGGWEVGWIAEPAGAGLLEGHPSLARLHRAPRGRALMLRELLQAAHELRAEAYDVAVDFQGLWKSAAWARLSGAPRLIGYARPWRRERLSSLLLRESVSLPPDLPHVLDKNLALLRPLGIEAVGSRSFPLPPTAAQAECVRKAVDALGLSRFAILNPGGGWPSKLWPAERYGAVARALRDRGIASLVTWGPGEQPLADRVVSAADGSAVRAFPTTLLEFVELARLARLVVAADTGPLHIACAVATPVVGLYGPTEPARNGPFSPDDKVVRRIPLCSPCHRHRCRIHEGVMGAIATAEVVRAIDARLGTTALAEERAG